MTFLEDLVFDQEIVDTMFDQLIFVCMAGALVIAILALIKVMIDYPGFGDWCMRIIHKKTAVKSDQETNEMKFEEIIVDVEAAESSSREMKVDSVESVGGVLTMSRTSTDPEICKRRIDELNEIVSFDDTPEGARRKANSRRHSHDHHHHHHRQRHHDRRHSHDHHHRHHHHRHGHLSSTDYESDHSLGRRKKYSKRSNPHKDSPHDSSETSHEAVDNIIVTPDDKKHKNNSNMSININNVNILINRHLHKDVTINIDMEEDHEDGGDGEQRVVVVDNVSHDDHEVRSSDSGIGWDEHHVHDAEVHDVHLPAGDIEPIEEEETERNVIVESENSEQDKLSHLDTLPINLPQRYRHNTFS